MYYVITPKGRERARNPHLHGTTFSWKSLALLDFLENRSEVDEAGAPEEELREYYTKAGAPDQNFPRAVDFLLKYGFVRQDLTRE